MPNPRGLPCMDDLTMPQSPEMPEVSEIAVVGGGLVGSALAYGLAKVGAEVLLLDAADDSFHASAGNFGLV